MRVSARGDYALRAMLDLALHHGGGLVPIQDVARRQGIPQRYLEQVLLTLKRAGLVESRRGSAGGYRLGRAPETIAVGDVLRAVEGRLTPLEVAGRPVGLDGSAGRPNGAGGEIPELWAEVARAVAAVLDRTSLRDLADRARARQAAAHPMYHI